MRGLHSWSAGFAGAAAAGGLFAGFGDVDGAGGFGGGFQIGLFGQAGLRGWDRERGVGAHFVEGWLVGAADLFAKGSGFGAAVDLDDGAGFDGSGVRVAAHLVEGGFADAGGTLR